MLVNIEAYSEKNTTFHNRNRLLTMNAPKKLWMQWNPQSNDKIFFAPFIWWPNECDRSYKMQVNFAFSIAQFLMMGLVHMGGEKCYFNQLNHDIRQELCKWNVSNPNMCTFKTYDPHEKIFLKISIDKHSKCDNIITSYVFKKQFAITSCRYVHRWNLTLISRVLTTQKCP